MTTNTVLITLYTLSAAIQVFGIWWTVTGFVREHPDHTGLYEIYIPTGWKAARGPGTIAAGIIIGLASNIATLYMV